MDGIAVRGQGGASVMLAGIQVERLHRQSLTSLHVVHSFSYFERTFDLGSSRIQRLTAASEIIAVRAFHAATGPLGKRYLKSSWLPD